MAGEDKAEGVPALSLSLPLSPSLSLSLPPSPSLSLSLSFSLSFSLSPRASGRSRRQGCESERGALKIMGGEEREEGEISERGGAGREAEWGERREQ